jgi:hypothetical protein
MRNFPPRSIVRFPHRFLTLSNWCIKGGRLLSPLYAALHSVLLSHPIIHVDEPTVQMLKQSGRDAQSTSYMWVYRTTEGSEQPVVLFEYQAGRGHVHPKRFLNGYRGTVMTDGYAAWRMQEGVTHLGCTAHARRRFDEALKAQKNPTGRAKEGLDFIRKLYRIEAQAWQPRSSAVSNAWRSSEPHASAWRAASANWMRPRAASATSGNSACPKTAHKRTSPITTAAL